MRCHGADTDICNADIVTDIAAPLLWGHRLHTEDGVVFAVLAAIDGVDARDEVLGVVFVPAGALPRFTALSP